MLTQAHLRWQGGSVSKKSTGLQISLWRICGAKSACGEQPPSIPVSQPTTAGRRAVLDLAIAAAERRCAFRATPFVDETPGAVVGSRVNRGTPTIFQRKVLAVRFKVVFINHTSCCGVRCCK